MPLLQLYGEGCTFWLIPDLLIPSCFCEIRTLWVLWMSYEHYIYIYILYIYIYIHIYTYIYIYKYPYSYIYIYIYIYTYICYNSWNLSERERGKWWFSLEEFWPFSAFVMVEIRLNRHQLIKISMIYVYLKLKV